MYTKVITNLQVLLDSSGKHGRLFYEMVGSGTFIYDSTFTPTLMKGLPVPLQRSVFNAPLLDYYTRRLNKVLCQKDSLNQYSDSFPLYVSYTNKKHNS